MADKGKKKITVLKDNPPLSGKKFFLMSVISPESRQQHTVHGLKLHDMCETEEEGRELAKYYHELDPDFDVLLGVVGKWCPFLFDTMDVPDVEYANKELTNLIKSHRMHRNSMDKHWKSEHEKNVEEIRKGNTREGQMELANKKEPAVSVWFKIKQIEQVIKARKDELDAMQELFHTKYPKSERLEAKKAQLPLSEPSPMQYTLLGSDVNEHEQQQHEQQENEHVADEESGSSSGTA